MTILYIRENRQKLSVNLTGAESRNCDNEIRTFSGWQRFEKPLNINLETEFVEKIEKTLKTQKLWKRMLTIVLMKHRKHNHK